MMIIFTSGVTAAPKGVVHTHGCWVRHTANVADASDTPFDQRLLCGLPFFWIGGVSTTLGVFMQRRTTLLCTEKFDPEAAMALVAKERPTGIMMLPGLMDRLRAHAAATGTTSLLPASPVPAPGARRGAQLGMTETFAAYIINGREGQTIPPEHADAHGFAVPGMQYRIADLDTGETLPEGTEGEICVRGYNLTDRHVQAGAPRGLRRRRLVPHGGQGHHPRALHHLPGPGQGPHQDGGRQRGAPGGRGPPRRRSRRAHVGRGAAWPTPSARRSSAPSSSPRRARTSTPRAVVRRAGRDLSAYKVPRRVLVLAEADVPYLATGKPDRNRLRDLLVAKGSDLPPA